MDDFLFALDHSPEIPLDVETLVIPEYECEIDPFYMTITSTFDSSEALVTAAKELQTLLVQCSLWYASNPSAQAQLLELYTAAPLELPVVEWLTARDLPLPQIGIGWQGKETEIVSAVARIGNTLCLSKLKSTSEYLSNDKADKSYSIHHPLVSFFEVMGGKILVENCYSEESIVADLTCSCSETEGQILVKELDHYRSLYYYLYGRPPWHPKAISPKEARARETFKKLSRNEPISSDDDPEIVSKNQQRSSFSDYRQWGADIGSCLGQLNLVNHNGNWNLAPEEVPLSVSTMNICFKNSALSLGWITFEMFIYGFPSIIQYLAKHGCTDFKYSLVDFNEVRGD
jgi:hypothetical protein